MDAVRQAMTALGYVDPFGSLAEVPDGVDAPEITPEVWGARHRTDTALPWVRRLIAASGVVVRVEAMLREDRDRRRAALGLMDKSGRPSAFPFEAVLVCLFMCKLAGRSMDGAEVARFALRTLTDDERTGLGIKNVLSDPTANPTKARYLLDEEAVAARVERVLVALDEAMNPVGYSQPRKRTKQKDKETLRRKVTPDRLAEAQDRLDEVVGLIMAAPIKAMPRALRRQYKGDAAVDGTPIPLHVGPTGQGLYVPNDVSAGWYTRGKGMNDRDAPKDQGGEDRPVSKKGFWAHDANLVVATDSTPGDRQYFPTVPLGFALDKPSTGLDRNALRVLRRLADAGIVRRHLGQDRAYPALKAENWHMPVRALGWMSMFDLRVDWLGDKDSEGGALQVEGHLYCPLTPQPLVQATLDLRNKKITAEQYAARIERRADYRLVKKQSARPNRDGTETVRLQSPAAGTSPKVACPLKPKSTLPHVIRQPNKAGRGDTRETVDISRAAELFPEGVLPDVCASGSISVDNTRLNKLQQALVYGSPEHSARLRAMRQSQEGYHGYTKRDSHEAIGRPLLRPRRGLPAQSLYAAIGLAVSCLRKTVWFMLRAQTDEQGRMWVKRRPRDKDNVDAPLGATGGYEFLDEDEGPPDGLWDDTGH